MDSRKWLLSKRSIKMWPEFSSSMMIQGSILILFTVFDGWFLDFLFNIPSLKFHFRFLIFDFPPQWWSFKLVWHAWYPSYPLNFWNLKLDFRLRWVNWSVPWLILRTKMSEKRNTTRKKWIYLFTGKSLTKFRLSLKMIPMTLWKPLFWRYWAGTLNGFWPHPQVNPWSSYMLAWLFPFFLKKWGKILYHHAQKRRTCTDHVL